MVLSDSHVQYMASNQCVLTNLFELVRAKVSKVCMLQSASVAYAGQIQWINTSLFEPRGDVAAYSDLEQGDVHHIAQVVLRDDDSPGLRLMLLSVDQDSMFAWTQRPATSNHLMFITWVQKQPRIFLEWEWQSTVDHDTTAKIASASWTHLFLSSLTNFSAIKLCFQQPHMKGECMVLSSS